jgi:hypothetical protein
MSNSCILLTSSCVFSASGCMYMAIFLNQFKTRGEGVSCARSTNARRSRLPAQAQLGACRFWTCVDEDPRAISRRAPPVAVNQTALVPIDFRCSSTKDACSSLRSPAGLTRHPQIRKRTSRATQLDCAAQSKSFDARVERLLGFISKRDAFRWGADVIMLVDFKNDCLTAVEFHRTCAERVVTNECVSSSIPFLCDKRSEARIGTRSKDEN